MFPSLLHIYWNRNPFLFLLLHALPQSPRPIAVHTTPKLRNIAPHCMERSRIDVGEKRSAKTSGRMFVCKKAA